LKDNTSVRWRSV